MRWLCHDDTATFFWFVGVEWGFVWGRGRGIWCGESKYHAFFLFAELLWV